MEVVALTVQGEEAWSLPRAIADLESEARFDYDGDGFAVIVVEQYFYRIISSIQITVIFDLVDEDVMEVRLIAGGGSAGLARGDVGAEGTALHDLVGKIRRFGNDLTLEIERR